MCNHVIIIFRGSAMQWQLDFGANWGFASGSIAFSKRELQYLPSFRLFFFLIIIVVVSLDVIIVIIIILFVFSGHSSSLSSSRPSPHEILNASWWCRDLHIQGQVDDSVHYYWTESSNWYDYTGTRALSSRQCLPLNAKGWFLKMVHGWFIFSLQICSSGQDHLLAY